MRNKALALSAALVAAQTVSAADITGKVVLLGTPKPEIKIDFSSDPRCAALHTEPLFTRHYVVGEGNGLANVFVYIKDGLQETSLPVPTEKPVLDQVGCEYKPYVLGLQVNQPFLIRNSDPTLHNVHYTPAGNSPNKEFNLAQPRKGITMEKVFSSPEIGLRFKCDVHPWMFAYICVVDHPFFAVTDANGNFTIKNVPPGTYTLAAWHVKTHRGETGVRKEVTVEGDTQVEFAIELE